MVSRRCACLVVIHAIVLLLLIPGLCRAAGGIQQKEEEMGRKYSEEIEHDLKIIEQGDELERIQRIGDAIARVACQQKVTALYGSDEVCKFSYEFKLVDDKDVNAFSLPGGIIYINTGLMELVESDDELAGVLAHEIAHSAHHHVSYLVNKQTKVDRYIALLTLLGLLGNMRSQDLNNVLLGAQMVKVAKINSYSQVAETDADRTAVTYLAKAGYNPEGILTFMKKLEKKHEENPTLPLGIFQTHPSPYHRAFSIAQAMKDEGLDIDTREIRNVAFAKSVPVSEGSDHYQVVISGRVMCSPAGLGGGPSSKERADAIADRVNRAIDEGLAAADVRCNDSQDCLMAGEIELLRIEPEDAPASNTNADRALLDKARSALSFALWADWLDKCCRQELQLAD